MYTAQYFRTPFRIGYNRVCSLANNCECAKIASIIKQNNPTWQYKFDGIDDDEMEATCQLLPGKGTLVTFYASETEIQEVIVDNHWFVNR